MPDEVYENLVKNLQSYLNKKNLVGFRALAVDGEMGPKTLARAQAYQSVLKTKTPPKVPPVPEKAGDVKLVWRLAHALTVLRSQINNQWPNRSKESDGTIGDAKHASRSSDHNPWVHDHTGQPVVHAIDITHDPANGVDCTKLVDNILHDPRIKYIIWRGRIWNPSIAMKWRKYEGSNQHTKHCHISLKDDEANFDNEKPWSIV